MADDSLVVAPNTPNTPLFDSKGNLNYAWLKWFQNITQAVNNSTTLLGEIKGQLKSTATISGRGGTLGSITQNLDNTGIVTQDGVDFSRHYVNQSTDFITDGAGNPLQGGRTAFQALVASGPVTGRALVFNSGAWQPEQIQYNNVSGTPTVPNTESAGLHKWFNGYNDTTGSFSSLQPAFSDLAGQIATAQLPASGFSGTVPLAKITVGGADGSLTVVNGLITAVVNPT